MNYIAHADPRPGQTLLNHSSASAGLSNFLTQNGRVAARLACAIFMVLTAQLVFVTFSGTVSFRRHRGCTKVSDRAEASRVTFGSP